jgi:hypothetical protein
MSARRTTITRVVGIVESCGTRGVEKVPTRWVKSTLIAVPGFCAGSSARMRPGEGCRDNGRMLLVNLLQSSRSTFSCEGFLSFFAFKAGMLGMPISVLGGWPTVSGRFLLVLRAGYGRGGCPQLCTYSLHPPCLCSAAGVPPAWAPLLPSGPRGRASHQPRTVGHAPATCPCSPARPPQSGGEGNGARTIVRSCGGEVRRHPGGRGLPVDRLRHGADGQTAEGHGTVSATVSEAPLRSGGRGAGAFDPGSDTARVWSTPPWEPPRAVWARSRSRRTPQPVGLRCLAARVYN